MNNISCCGSFVVGWTVQRYQSIDPEHERTGLAQHVHRPAKPTNESPGDKQRFDHMF